MNPADLDTDELTGLAGLHQPMRIRYAATISGVSEARIRQWKRRGHLQPAGRDEFGRPTYRPIDVLRAEAATRQPSRAQA